MSEKTKNALVHIVVNVVYVIFWLLMFKLAKMLYRTLKTKWQSFRSRDDIVAAES